MWWEPGSGWPYNRLNGDYPPLHALCRFFLKQAGLVHERGGFETIPFRRAVLIYPAMPKRPFNGFYGAGEVMSITVQWH
ncbi:MAG: hypothetical protein JWQ98_2219 [Chlorobi bacterium]|nr:hypothetical protein [Chlorobiota bacterium]